MVMAFQIMSLGLRSVRLIVATGLIGSVVIAVWGYLVDG